MCPFESLSEGPVSSPVHAEIGPTPAAPEAAAPSRLRREIAGMSYSQQVARLSPAGAGVQMKADSAAPLGSVEAIDYADPVQMDTTTGVAGSGEFKDIKPEDTLTTEHYKAFEANYNKLLTSLGETGDPKPLWIQVVTTLQATHEEWKKAPTTDVNGRARTDLSSAAAKDVMKDLDGIIGECKNLMDMQAKHVTEWSFWSGTPAMKVAMSVGTCLETSALGSLFNGININGSWDIGLWGALSNAYAEAVANNLTDKSVLRGFVGLGSSTAMSIFNQIEQPKFKSICEDHQLSPTITWFACVGLPGDIGTPDPTAKAGGIEGCLQTGDRGSMVALAESENNKRKAMPKAP